MSKEKKNQFHCDPFNYDQQETTPTSVFPLYKILRNQETLTQNSLQGSYSSSSHMSFTDCLHGSMDYNTSLRALDMSCSTSELITPTIFEDYSNKISESAAATTVENPSTPNSSISSSSNDAPLTTKQEFSGSNIKKEKPDENKKGKPSKKEKRQKEPRCAFLTRSEIDHLEDGYRWRKYGQKAVKNSPYPRSYYRCTSQKCTVKKRVERSFQDPSIVITTYEGQHNHYCPANLRGNAVAGMLSPSLLASTAMATGPTSYPQELFARFVTSSNQSDSNHAMLYQHLVNSPQQHFNVPHDYGLLQDLLPSFVLKQQP